MTEKNTGGSAFPGIVDIDLPPAYDHNGNIMIQYAHTEHRPGMTLRDYFAGQALMEWSSMIELQRSDEFVAAQMKIVSGICYRFADAMIEARNK